MRCLQVGHCTMDETKRRAHCCGPASSHHASFRFTHPEPCSRDRVLWRLVSATSLLAACCQQNLSTAIGVLLHTHVFRFALDLVYTLACYSIIIIVSLNRFSLMTIIHTRSTLVLPIYYYSGALGRVDARRVFRCTVISVLQLGHLIFACLSNPSTPRISPK